LAADAGGDLSAEPTTGESLGARVGTRIRQRRLELDRTLAEVAASADLSVGYLSSIEKGGKVPSLPVLARLAHALEMSLAEILRTSASSRLSRGSLTSRLGQERLNAEGSQLRIVRLSGKPGSRGKAPLAFGRGDVFVYVHRGEFEIDVDGSVFEVGAGDALHGDRPRSMTWRVTGDQTATSVWAAAATPKRNARADGH
jgi:transcriptional regulator with XRE-family HTH domain